MSWTFRGGQRRLLPADTPQNVRQLGRRADSPLHDKTPREAICTKEGKRDVIELLKSHEMGEAKRAKLQQCSPVSFDVLWESLGLKR
jgi:hypothetical protein